MPSSSSADRRRRRTGAAPTQPPPSMPSTHGGGGGDDDDDFQTRPNLSCSQKPLQLSTISSNRTRPTKKPKRSSPALGKENAVPASAVGRSGPEPRESLGRRAVGSSDASKGRGAADDFELTDADCALDLIESSIDCERAPVDRHVADGCGGASERNEKLEVNKGYLSHSIESRLIKAKVDFGFRDGGNYRGFGGVDKNEKNGSVVNGGSGSNSTESGSIAARANCGLSDVGDDRVSGVHDDECDEQFEVGADLDLLIKLCDDEGPVHYSDDKAGEEAEDGWDCDSGLVCCPLCGVDISDLSDESRQIHTNDCLDEGEARVDEASLLIFSSIYCHLLYFCMNYQVQYLYGMNF